MSNKKNKTEDSLETQTLSKKKSYYVAENKALTSKKGILGAGEEVKESDLAGGKQALEAFVKSGHVVSK